MRAAIELLPAARQRQVLRLMNVDGLAQSEVCEVLVVDIDAARRHAERCEGTKCGNPSPVELAELGLDAFEWRRSNSAGSGTWRTRSRPFQRGKGVVRFSEMEWRSSSAIRTRNEARRKSTQRASTALSRFQNGPYGLRGQVATSTENGKAAVGGYGTSGHTRPGAQQICPGQQRPAPCSPQGVPSSAGV